MREWLTFLIILLILGVVLDGIRRMRISRRNSLKMSSRMDDTDIEQQDTSEFPSGGRARVVGYRDPDDAHSLTENLRQNYRASKVTLGAPNRIPDQVALSLDEPEPMLKKSAGEEKRPRQEPNEELLNEESSDPTLGDLDDLDDDAQPVRAASSFAGSDLGQTAVAEPSERAPEQQAKPDVPSPSRSRGWGAKTTRENTETGKDSQGDAKPDEVLIINVMAHKGETFHGADLLPALLEQGFRFGSMDIFHRHENKDGTGHVLFSLANMVVPGTFDLSKMDDFETPGVSIFMTLPIHYESLAAFNIMADAARGLAASLGGELKDENRSVMTQQTIEHARQRVIEYERKRRLLKT